MSAILLALAGAAVAGAALVYVGAISGALTLDVGVGRRLRELGPLEVAVAARRERVWELLALPYVAEQPPRALAEKVQVLERGADVVVAAHRTKLPLLTAVTVEAVGLAAPEALTFRLLRGPVPFVTERIELQEVGDGTTVAYTGTLGTDFWLLGRAWGRLVARTWVRTVERSLADVKAAAER